MKRARSDERDGQRWDEPGPLLAEARPASRPLPPTRTYKIVYHYFERRSATTATARVHHESRGFPGLRRNGRRPTIAAASARPTVITTSTFASPPRGRRAETRGRPRVPSQTTVSVEHGRAERRDREARSNDSCGRPECGRGAGSPSRRSRSRSVCAYAAEAPADEPRDPTKGAGSQRTGDHRAAATSPR